MRRLLFLFFIHCSIIIQAQENLGILSLAPRQPENDVALRLTTLSLPFRDDFSHIDSTNRVSSSMWEPSAVYVNNQFASQSYNVGMVTMDGLDMNGNPYSSSVNASVYADSLTSHPIDLSTFTTASNAILSFSYLPGGLGHKPRPLDTLLIYANSVTSGWVLLDFVLPDTVSTWRIKMIQLLNPSWFHEDFKIRFVNKSTMGIAPSSWHIDNVYLNADRGLSDSLLSDVAFTNNATNMLKDFTAMPFKHFNTDKNAFIAGKLVAHLSNRQTVSYAIPTVLRLYNDKTNAIIYTSNNTKTLSAISRDTVAISMPSTTLINADSDGDLRIRAQYTLTSPSADLWKGNDSIVHYQTFDNYFAYDDGSSESSYYLNLYPSAPGRIAVEYKNYVPDTIAGIDIQFANPTPDQSAKEFFIQIYRDIEEGSNSGTLIYEQRGCFPQFPTDNSGFVRYPLDDIVPLPEGQFFVVIMMPTGGISDSLMIGLDRNRIAANHRYYSIEDIWLSSTLEGALMLRPVMSGVKLPASIDTDSSKNTFNVFPNPADIKISIDSDQDIINAKYEITDISGRILMSGTIDRSKSIGIAHLPRGLYHINIISGDNQMYLQKFLKQ